MRAREIMVDALRVAPELPVRDLVSLLLREQVDGACVLDHGRLVGVVTTMDLVFQEKQVHLPSALAFMDFVIPLEPPERLRHELDKIAASTVRHMMSGHPLWVEADTPMAEVASLMVDRHVSVVPVMEQGELIGMITKPALLRAAFPGRSGPA
ncbi:CBS domain-containing protein [Nannocystaceae bacterium ST9]